MTKKFTVKFLEGRKCIFCGSWNLYRLADGRVKCRKCGRFYSVRKLKKDVDVLHHFCLELSARKTAKELDLSYNTVHNKYMFFREKIAENLENNFKKLSGELELDETYFGGKRKGKRGRGAFNKTIIFGILERDGKVYTSVVPDVSDAASRRTARPRTS